jgi:hypothetical protein
MMTIADGNFLPLKAARLAPARNSSVYLSLHQSDVAALSCNAVFEGTPKAIDTSGCRATRNESKSTPQQSFLRHHARWRCWLH